MTWYFHNTTEEFTEDKIGNNFGFVYLITHMSTGRKYVGKKFFSKAGYKQVKGKRKKIRKTSDWEKYWGSNKELQEEVKKNGKNNTPVRYCIFVKLVVSVLIMKLGNYLLVMHF
jgi:hypothetical protein